VTVAPPSLLVTFVGVGLLVGLVVILRVGDGDEIFVGMIVFVGTMVGVDTGSV